MKHIKLFESFESKHQYDKVTQWEYTLFMGDHKMIEFSSDEVEYLESLGIGNVSMYETAYNIKAVRIVDDTSVMSELSIYIMKYDDEWYSIYSFYQGFHSSYFICDEWEGVKELLREECYKPKSISHIS